MDNPIQPAHESPLQKKAEEYLQRFRNGGNPEKWDDKDVHQAMLLVPRVIERLKNTQMPGEEWSNVVKALVYLNFAYQKARDTALGAATKAKAGDSAVTVHNIEKRWPEIHLDFDSKVLSKAFLEKERQKTFAAIIGAFAHISDEMLMSGVSMLKLTHHDKRTRSSELSISKRLPPPGRGK